MCVKTWTGLLLTVEDVQKLQLLGRESRKSLEGRICIRVPPSLNLQGHLERSLPVSAGL